MKETFVPILQNRLSHNRIYAVLLEKSLSMTKTWDGRNFGDIKDANAINSGLMTVLRNAFSVPVTKREQLRLQDYNSNLAGTY